MPIVQKIISVILGLFLAGRPGAAPDAQTQAGGVLNSGLFLTAIGGALAWMFSDIGRAWRMEFSAIEVAAFVLIGVVVSEWMRQMKPPGAP